MKTKMVPAVPEQLDDVLDFVNSQLAEYNGSVKIQMQLNLAVEEVFINIANYAYHPEIGEATVRCEVEGDPLRITIQFIDGGKPYNPLEKDDPDITLSVEERNIGGLGVYLVKQIMDAVSYEYKDGKNILTMQKTIQ
jgi:serine/threonine-protein kinase RsbW